MRIPAVAFFCVATWATALVCPVQAALEFAATEITLKPALGEKTIVAEFKFKNTGDAPLAITRVHSGCGCTVPEKPAEPIAPGASGVIPVTYKPGDHQGPQHQQIEVETADGKVQQLRLVIDLPVRISFAPRLLLFRGADQEPKTATVTYGADDKTEFLGVTLQSPAFEVVGEPKLENSVVKIVIRHSGPADADARASVRVRTRDSAGVEHTDLLYLRHSP